MGWTLPIPKPKTLCPESVADWGAGRPQANEIPVCCIRGQMVRTMA